MLKKLKSSLIIILEGVAIAIIAIIGIIVFGTCGVIKWTWDRLAETWND